MIKLIVENQAIIALIFVLKSLGWGVIFEGIFSRFHGRTFQLFGHTITNNVYWTWGDSNNPGLIPAGQPNAGRYNLSRKQKFSKIMHIAVLLFWYFVLRLDDGFNVQWDLIFTEWKMWFLVIVGLFLIGTQLSERLQNFLHDWISDGYVWWIFIGLVGFVVSA